MTAMKIGVDVGGTHTDAVVMNGDAVTATTKRPTTADVSSGIVAALRSVLDSSGLAPPQVEAVMIGTTHFSNALVERRHLLEVAVIRAALPACRDLPPMIDWPADLAAAIGQHRYLVAGGYEFDGREISPLCDSEVSRVARDIRRKGLRSVAVSSVFAPVNTTMEERIARIVRRENPGIHVTLSSALGRIGLLERENAAILNAALSALATKVVSSLGEALEILGISAPFYLSQNDGTLMNAEVAERYPILTFASGSTNSIRGAAYLSGAREAIVVDIGGTTTDVGMLSRGFPRESAFHAEIGGVRTNFRMPDTLTLALGGGSRVHGEAMVRIGPDSVGFRLIEKARVFGGETLTVTDIAVAAGLVNMGKRQHLEHLDQEKVERALLEIHRQIAEAVDRTKTSAAEVPLILVGGGAFLLDRPVPGISDLIRPEHATVANAIGVAVAQIGGEVDRIFSYQEVGRDRAVATAKSEAIERARQSGARRETIEVVSVEEVPLTYLPGGAVRLRVKAVGEMSNGHETVASRARGRA